jgi:hypothetical protein
MHFLFDVQVTDNTIKKPYNPTKLEIWVTGADENGNVQLQTETTEILEGEVNGNGKGTRIERRTFTYPAAAIQAAITGVDITNGNPTISAQAVNQLLAAYNLQVI